MKIEFQVKESENTRNFDDVHQKNFATRLERTLKNLADQVVEIQVFLEDQSPSKNNLDGHCKIQVALRKGNPVIVNAYGASYTDLISEAMNRVQHALEKVFDKKKDKRGSLSAADV